MFMTAVLLSPRSWQTMTGPAFGGAVEEPPSELDAVASP